ncbi:hypothetical protein ACK85N_004898 [Salmonella enterica]|nr:hypothetical protein [Salmonella enterica]EMD3278265.1 hypothetical protein [Salmonella enterica]EMD3377530.1 hypothetical protein [Salmonella enterica]EMD3481871.1 hypothetical protein [Salmonella enterica]EMD3519233.1 hypothetical protein [Salmonella enterica]
MSVALIGFVLLVNPCGHDAACEWEPVTERVYQQERECREIMLELQRSHPDYDFSCGKVYRHRKEGTQ